MREKGREGEKVCINIQRERERERGGESERKYGERESRKEKRK